MANTYIPPEITVMLDPLGSGEWRLMATSHLRTEFAGERLLRTEPWPQIKFRHSSHEEGERDAEILRTYLADCASGKRKDRGPVGRGWWQD